MGASVTEEDKDPRGEPAIPRVSLELYSDGSFEQCIRFEISGDMFSIYEGEHGAGYQGMRDANDLLRGRMFAMEDMSLDVARTLRDFLNYAVPK